MKKWDEKELEIAFSLYCQMPFGKIHSRNILIQKTAEKLDRTPSSIAMKMLNFASLDPEITGTGRKGLGNASGKDREIWEKFHKNWEDQVSKNEDFFQDLFSEENDIKIYEAVDKTIISQSRTKQSFFRKSILSNYKSTCCMSGLSEPRLLIASHIVPWSKSKENRLNPRNGLCLSALHDRAFDQGLIAVLPDYSIRISASLRQNALDQFSKDTLIALEGKEIAAPEKFTPDTALLEYHYEHIFQK